MSAIKSLTSTSISIKRKHEKGGMWRKKRYGRKEVRERWRKGCGGRRVEGVTEVWGEKGRGSDRGVGGEGMRE